MFPPITAIFTALAVVLVLAKIPIAIPYENFEGIPSLIAITTEDIFWIVALCGLSAYLSRKLSRNENWQRRLLLSLETVAVIAAIYAVANIGVNAALKQPLNSRVLAMMKDVGNISSSASEYLNAKLIIAALAAPLFVILANRALRRRNFPRSVARGLALGSALWILWGGAYLWSTDPDAWQRRAGRNPHREFIGSYLFDYLTDQKAGIITNFQNEHMDDFIPASDRPMPPVAKAPKNIILFTLESTSAQYLSVYGASHDTTPNLVAESNHSLIFERAYAHVGYTFCSFMSLVYSVYPGLPWKYQPGFDRPMHKALVGSLKERNYRSAFFSAAFPTWGGMDYMAKKAGFQKVFAPRDLAPDDKITSWGCEDAPMMDGLLKWIAEDAARPFFALAWTNQTHHPYTVSDEPPAITFEENGKPVTPDKNRYLNAIRQSDYQLGRLFQFLREKNLDRDTLVIITGDHGEAFGSPHPTMGHGSALFDENLRVPMIFWAPGFYAGQRETKPVGHVDINPTLAQMLGTPIPKAWQGCSILSPNHPGRVYMIADRDGFQFGVMDHSLKSIFYATAGYEQMFDLKMDPLEQNNLAYRQKDKASELRSRISAFIKYEEAYLKNELVPGPTGDQDSE
jgi:arylsulfatase A-like enzyme